IHVHGEAGLGKSRLLDELERRLDGVAIGRARCSELEQHLPYVPLAAAMRHAFADLASDVRRLPALGQVFPELASATPERRVDEIEVLEALGALVVERGPVVPLLDDPHWADTSTLASLASLRRRSIGRGVALVTAALPPRPSCEDQLRRLAPDTILRL